jgi:DnaK suppressor protein
VDDARAQQLLDTERQRVQTLLDETAAAERQDRLAEAEPGDLDDPAQPLASQGVDDAVAESLRDRLTRLDRAAERLAAGTYGVSVQSGEVIPDERLEADPAAELTVAEASA